MSSLIRAVALAFFVIAIASGSPGAVAAVESSTASGTSVNACTKDIISAYSVAQSKFQLDSMLQDVPQWCQALFEKGAPLSDFQKEGCDSLAEQTRRAVAAALAYSHNVVQLAANAPTSFAPPACIERYKAQQDTQQRQNAESEEASRQQNVLRQQEENEQATRRAAIAPRLQRAQRFVRLLVEKAASEGKLGCPASGQQGDMSQLFCLDDKERDAELQLQNELQREASSVARGEPGDTHLIDKLNNPNFVLPLVFGSEKAAAQIKEGKVNCDNAPPVAISDGTGFNLGRDACTYFSPNKPEASAPTLKDLEGG